MAKVAFNSKIEEHYAEILDTLYAKLGGNRYRIIEASLDIFNVLPAVLQRALISYDEEERRSILSIISELKSPPPSKKAGKR